MTFPAINRFCDGQLKKPSLALAVVFVVLPLAFGLLLRFFVGINPNYSQLGFEFFKSIILLLVSAGILYFLIYFFKGKDVSGKFTSLLCALSLRHFFYALFFLFGVIVLFAIVPEFFSFFRQVQSGTSTAEQAAGMLSGLTSKIEGKNPLALAAGFGMIMLGGILFLFLNLFLVYSIITAFSSQNQKRNVFILILFVLFQIIFLQFF